MGYNYWNFSLQVEPGFNLFGGGTDQEDALNEVKSIALSIFEKKLIKESMKASVFQIVNNPKKGERYRLMGMVYEISYNSGELIVNPGADIKDELQEKYKKMISKSKEEKTF